MTKRKHRQPSPARRPVGAAWLRPAEWGLAVALTTFALFFQVTFMTNAGPLWRDEVNTVEFASMPSMSQVLASLPYDGFPLFSTMVLRAWVASGLGRSDFGLRVFGFLVGVLFLVALWLAGRLLRGSTPLVSLALVGLSPWVVSTVASIRPYGIGMVFIVLTLGLVWKAVEAPSLRRFLLAGATAILSVQCMYQNAVLLFGICVAGAVVSLRSSRPKVAGAVVMVGIAAALSLLPYLPGIAVARGWNVVIQTPTSVGQLFSTFGIALGTGEAPRAWLWIALSILGAALGIRALAAHPRSGGADGGSGVAAKGSNVALYCALVLVVTTVVFLAALKATRLPTEPWYYVPLMVTVAPALDAALSSASTDAMRKTARLGLVLVIAVSALLSGRRQLTERRTNLDAVAAHLMTQSTEGDAIIVYPPYYGVGFQRYYKGAARWMTLPPMEETRIHRYDLVKSAMTRSNAIDPVLDAMSQALASGHRVWLVGGLPAPDMSKPPPSLPPAPAAPSGWYCGPYLIAWGQQASHLLNARAQRGDPVPALGKSPINPYENVPVMVVSGWR